MGRKNTVPSFQMFGTAGADMSATATVSSVSTVPNMDNIGIVVNWTGTSPVGTLTVNCSNDQITWVNLDFGTAIAISGNTGSHIISINQLPFSYLRATYTKTSGTGTIYANISTKQIGG